MRRRGLAMLIAGVLAVATGLVVIHVAGTSETADCSRLEREDAADAAVLAAACGDDVEIVAERSPWMSVFARPDGTSRMSVSVVPSQTDVNGEWEPLNTDVLVEPAEEDDSAAGVGPGSGGGAGSGGIVSTARVPASAEDPDEGGMLPVAAPVFPMQFNPGGEAGADLPLGAVERDGAWVKLWFPLELPVPVVEDRFVTYELAPGVRLVVAVMADGSGFRPIVELDSPDAAAWFRDALEDARVQDGLPGTGFDIAYRVEASAGLELRSVDEVGFEFADAEGEVLFWSPPSTMWDSAAGPDDEAEGPERAEFPRPGDRSVRMPVHVADADEGAGTVVMSPDEEMLTAAETVWPVRIDPTLGGRTPAEWVAIRTGGYTSPIYKWTDTSARNGESMGLCSLSWSSSCGTTFTSRLVWEFGGTLSTWMKTLDGSDIISASFTADPGGRGSCTSTRTDAYRTVSITQEQRTWSTLTFSSYLANVTAPQGDSCSDSGVRRGWDVRSAVMTAADGNAASINIGLKANSESNSNGYKTYRADARLDIVYNRPPNAPTSVRLTSPALTCTSGTARQAIASTTPTIAGVVSDPDGGTVQPQFQVLIAGTDTEVWSSGTLAAKASGSAVSAAVPSGKLVHGQRYQYRIRASDGSKWSSWSAAKCEFAVDIEKPASPVVAPVRSGVAAVYEEDVERGGVGMSGKFTLTRGSSSAIASIRYSFNSTTLGSTATPGSDGSVTISYTPTTTGPVTLRAAARDAAGNQSTTTMYVFDVGAAKEDGVWMMDEGEGETADDSSGVGEAQTLSVVGPEWADGPHALFDVRADDRSLRFDGVDDEATTGPVVDTTESFVVSAYVKLDADTLAGGRYTAVSQDGVAQSGFVLGYTPSCTGMPEGCWTFGVRNADTVGSTGTVAESSVPVVEDSWVHLVGAQDVTSQTLRLWVCEIGTPADPGDGVPVVSSIPRTSSPWSAAGAFVVGRAQQDRNPARWWPGQIDNVRVFSGQVVSESKIRRMCQGAEATDYGAGADALDPTTTNGE
ncbi:LamG domain-containing protein [Microbacterium tumbae]